MLAKISAMILVGFLVFGSVFVSPQTLSQTKLLEPNCQNPSTTAIWNPYPVNSISAAPILMDKNCQDIAMLSFGKSKAKKLTILNTQNIELQLYYNNGGSEAIIKPRAKIQVVKESPVLFKITAILSGDNVNPKASNELFVETVSGSDLGLNANSTFHFPKIIQNLNQNGKITPQLIPDNTINSDEISNTVFEVLENTNLTSKEGFLIEEKLERGFVNYGYISTVLTLNTSPKPRNKPPEIIGKNLELNRNTEITTQIQATDPEFQSLKLESKNIPSFCKILDLTISCKADEYTPTQGSFSLVAIDNKNKRSDPATIDYKIKEEGIRIIATCKVREIECDKNIKSGDLLEYKIKIGDYTGNLDQNLNISANFDKSLVFNVLDSTGQLDSTGSSINWQLTKIPEFVDFKIKLKEDTNSDHFGVNFALTSPNFGSKYVTKDAFLPELKTELSCKNDKNQDCNLDPLAPETELKFALLFSNPTEKDYSDLNMELLLDQQLEQISGLSAGIKQANKIILSNFNIKSKEKKLLEFVAKISNPSLETKKSLIIDYKITGGANIQAKKEWLTGGNIDFEKSIITCRKKSDRSPCAKLTTDDRIIYTFYVKNQGNRAAKNIKVTQILDQNLQEITNISENGILKDKEIVWIFDKLEAGQEKYLELEVGFKKQAQSLTIVNTGFVVADGIEPKTLKFNFFSSITERNYWLDYVFITILFVIILVAVGIIYARKKYGNLKQKINYKAENILISK